MSDVRPFLDTNILIYAFAAADRRQPLALAVLQTGGVVSTQVLNEFVSAAISKLGMSETEMEQSLATVRVLCGEVVDLTVADHDLALRLRREARLHIYDACIVASAARAGCDVLLTEDMQDGRRFGDLAVRNPFAGANDG